MAFTLAILACFLPPAVFAAFPPRTPAWRRARKVFWISLPLGAAVAAFNAYFIDPAGPAVVFYGAWFVFVLVAAAWCYATAIVRSEWSNWREARREATQPSPPAAPERTRTGSPKPWLK